MTINERIRALRKDQKLNQKQLAAALGLTQSGVSYMEQNGSTVSDSSIKSICSIYHVNEAWLRDGSDPMYIEPDTFSLDQFVRERGGTDLEIEIVKAYFELDKDARLAAVNYFLDRLVAAKERAAESEQATEREPTVEELEEQYKKTVLNPASKPVVTASNITGGILLNKAAGSE